MTGIASPVARYWPADVGPLNGNWRLILALSLNCAAWALVVSVVRLFL